MNLIRRVRNLWRPTPDDAHHYHPVRAECLVVEDEPDELNFLCGLIRMQGAIVVAATSIAGALEAIASPVQFQLAFVDLNLSTSSGIEVVRRVKTNKRGTHVVIVSADFEKIKLCLGWGYVGVMSKPYTVSSVREIFMAHRLPVND